jgi:transcriptional regulator with GAF, ATPase, and Fis domain
VRTGPGPRRRLHPRVAFAKKEGMVMTADGLDPARIARVVAALADGERDPRRSLCAASADVIGVRGAGVVLLSERRTLGNVCVSDAVIQAVEDAQYVLGEGPCVDAFHSRQPVLVADLAADARWPEFRRGALAAGMQAAFGYPLLVGPSCIGALDLFNDHAGALSDEQHANALAVAHVAGRTVLGWQSTAEPGLLAWQLEHVSENRAVVHQATGMISAQAEMSVGDAMALLRASAFAEDRPIGEVASDVVARRLRFD